MVKAKPNQKIHLKRLQTAFDKLEQLESKPVEELTLRESISFLRDKLNSALKKGYNYQDLSEILAEQDILISAATLKQYLTDVAKKPSSRRSKGKSNSIESANKSQKISINVTNPQEELAPSLENAQTSRIREPEPKGKSQTKTATGQSKGKKDTKSKPKVLSDLDRDLEREFNSF